MSTTASNALFNQLNLNDNEIQSAISFNEALNLKDRTIRLLQSMMGLMVTGKWGKDEVMALIHPDFSQSFITKAFILFAQANPQSVSSLGGIPSTFTEIMNNISKIATSGFWDELKGKLGRLSEPILEAIIDDLKNKKHGSQALMIAADYFKHKIDENILQLSYNPSLGGTFRTQVAFTNVSVSDSGSIRFALHGLLQIQLGKAALDNIEALKKVLSDAFNAKPQSTRTPRLSSNLSSSAKSKALEKNSTRFAHKQSVRVLQALVGAPVTGVMDETTVDGIAQFQRSARLGVDGIVGRGQTLPAMIKKAMNQHLYEAIVHLVAGYFNMNTEGLTYIFSHLESDVQLEGFQTNVPGTLFYHASSKLASMSVDDFLDHLCPTLNSMMLYKGSNFTGPNSARIDVAFLPTIEKVNQLAGQHGVKIFVSGPNSASFRPEGTVVQGAIVTPSKRSNHKIGHAIDMNLVSGATHLNSRLLAPSNESNWPSAVKNFINAIRQDPELRWGGDFSTPDPVHIDDALNNRLPHKYEQRFIATQTSFPYFGTGTRSVVQEDEILCDN